MNITNDILYVGVNDHQIDLFEGQYVVPNGMAYNSYVIRDEKIAVMDTVDARFTHAWLANLREALKDKAPDYLIIQHMEPDHSASIAQFLRSYPNATIVANAKAFTMMQHFYPDIDLTGRMQTVTDGETFTLGKHTLTFIFAPMVHWPEVMVTYDASDQVLFSADGFGKFGALDCEEDWACEARRYYFGIVGKYGVQVQNLLKKAALLDISIICPLHGPILTENLSYYLNLYQTWSSYGVESDGIFIAYTSVYGNTRKAVELLAEQLRAKGCPKVSICDLAREDMAEAVEDAFRYGKLVLATTTYNAEIFPHMRSFIECLTERGYQNRTIGLIENGSWAPLAAKIMRGMFENCKACKNLTWLEPTVRILSAVKSENLEQIDALSTALCQDYIAMSETAPRNDPAALFRIGYGLYVVTSNDGKKDNGLIVNTVTQVTNAPNRVAVTIHKSNYSHHVIQQTGKLNVNCLSTDAPFKVFENFGFQSGAGVDKFAGCQPNHSANGLVVLPHYINAYFSLEVENYVDCDTHGMFICRVAESHVVSTAETMTYTYYLEHVKPKPQTTGKKGYVCKICGYVHEGDLPEDFICPLCKHGIADFEPIEE